MNEQKYFALVTGASSGIGLAISRELAKCGYSIFLVSNEKTKLNEAASEIETQYKVKTISLCMDLAKSDSAQILFEYCQTNNIKIEILVNNAGIFFFKDITDTPLELIETKINLHILTTTMLCRLFADQMIKENRKGYILNISSIAAWIMMPGIALYNATKSYLRCFSRAMRNEIFTRGVSITTVCPGATATGLYNLPSRYLKLGVRLGIIMPPEHLAARVIKKMFKRKAEYIPGGFLNRYFIFLLNTIPERLIRWSRNFYH
jgi:short-subunit dehydrogenase